MVFKDKNYIVLLSGNNPYGQSVVISLFLRFVASLSGFKIDVITKIFNVSCF